MREKIEKTAVLAWLAEHYPELHAQAEIDREWVWLVVDLRGDEHAETRKAIGREGFGFRYAPRKHPLPSGRLGTWSHSCYAPTPFKRKGAKPGAKKAASDGQGERGASEEQKEALVDVSLADRIKAALARVKGVAA